jgi:bromodomain-containing factor 1
MTSSVDFPTKSVASNLSETNGAHKSEAVNANGINGSSVDLPDTQIEPESDEPQNASTSSPFVNTETDALNSLLPANPITISTQSQELNTTSQSPALAEELLNQASEIPPAPSSVPPVVEAQESDTRDELLPATQTQESEAMSDDHGLDLAADPDLASTFGEHSSAEQVAQTSELPASDDHPLHPASVSNLDLNHTSQDDILPEASAPLQPAEQDISMIDAPQSPSKIPREREDDIEVGPSAKRAKTEDESMTDAPEVSQASITQNGDVAPAPGDDLPPTLYQTKELQKAMKNIKGTTSGKNFVKAVADLWPTIKDSYLEKIKSPMDLSIIDSRLKQGYESIGAFKTDVSLIYNNALVYNGPEHVVTTAAATVRDYLLNKIPGPEPVKPEKKRKATPVADAAPRAPPARRQSRGATVTAGSPTSATPAQTFALDPSGTPLIRRDSTKGEGGRPKREIHPPKSKDLIYNARPKKKKFATELKFCEEVLGEIKKPKYHQWSSPFLVPVDPVALGIPDYFKIIKTPMDLSTVTTRLNTGQYENAKDFEADIKQIFKNCYKFNPPGSPVHEMGKAFEEVFDREWSKKAQWIADHATENAASPSSTADSDEDESEEDEPEEPQSSTSLIQERLIEEQNKLIAIMGAKKPDPALVRMQQDMIAIIQKQMDTENAKKAKAKPKPKPTKKGAVSKKKADPKQKAYRAKNIGVVEKEQISAGIVQLDGKLLDQAVAYLKMDYPNLNVSHAYNWTSCVVSNRTKLDDETELDIDTFSNPVLSRLHDLIIKNVPGIVPAKSEPARVAKPSKPKKNKPMSKTEQEAKIEKLKKLKDQFERQGSTSDDAPGGRVVPC